MYKNVSVGTVNVPIKLTSDQNALKQKSPGINAGAILNYYFYYY
jgi:hypothetical protein